MTFWGLKCCDLSLVLTHAHSGFYYVYHVVAELLAFVLIGGAVLYQLVEGYGSTFVSCELDEMYIESKNLVYQIGIEDGAVFAVVLNFCPPYIKILSHKDACHPLSNSNFLHATIAILHDIQSLGWSRQSLTIY